MFIGLMQDLRRQQQYIDHLEGEVVRLQQMLQVRLLVCSHVPLLGAVSCQMLAVYLDSSRKFDAYTQTQLQVWSLLNSVCHTVADAAAAQRQPRPRLRATAQQRRV